MMRRSPRNGATVGALGLAGLSLILLVVGCGGAETKTGVEPAQVERVSVADARARVQAGSALLVCAYDDSVYAKYALEGSMALGAFQAKLAELPLDQEIIFYCA